MPAPTITRAVSGQTTTSETPIDPFSGVTMRLECGRDGHAVDYAFQSGLFEWNRT